jgi:hypothetical protein
MNRDWRAALHVAKDPWIYLVSAIGGGVGWAAGVPVIADVGVGVAMAATGIFANSFVKSAGDGDDWDKKDPEPKVLVRQGTPQAGLLDSLHGYLDDLSKLRHSDIPDAVQNSAIDALVAADGASAQAGRVAEAIDRLDDAIARSGKVADQMKSDRAVGVWASLDRMKERREGLLSRLDGAVADVAEVYTKLIELSATADTMIVGSHGVSEIEEVNKSLDQLRTAFAELESDTHV